MNEFEKQMMNRASEIIKAQPDLEEQSRIREKYKIQFGKAFHHEDGLGNEDIERRPCTQKEKEKLNDSIEQLGDFFSGSDFLWQLDGALNISLYRGEYIGIHKDIDVSIDSREIEKIESFIAKKGYGFFLSSWNQEKKQRTFERVDSTKFIKNRNLQWMIIAIDENGKRRHDGSLSHIDTHIIRWNEDGEPLGHYETTIPKEWLTPEVITFHGRKINCSNPALAAYHKLFFTRAYDDNDLKLLAQSGKLTLEDIDLVEQTFNKHAEDIQKIIKVYVGRVLPKIETAKDKQEIFDVLMNDELISSQKENEETKKFCRDLSEKIIKTGNMTVENLYAEIFATTPISKLLPKMAERFAMLRQNILESSNNI